MTKHQFQILLSLGFVLFISSVIGQNKKEFFFDKKNNLIDEDTFKNYDYRSSIPVKVENDSAIIHKIIPNLSFGIIPYKEKRQFYESLENITDSKIDTSKTIIVSFFYKKHSCLQHYLADKHYLESIESHNNLQQIFITEKGYRYRRNKTSEDRLDYFKNTFFKYAPYCGNYLIVKPNGTYFKKYGEFVQNTIVSFALSDWKDKNKTVLKFFEDYIIRKFNLENPHTNGKLNNVQKTQLFSLLKKITNKELNKNAYTIIHFFNNHDEFLDDIVNNKKYWELVHKNPNSVNSMVIGLKNSNIEEDRVKNLFIDDYNIIKNLFLNKSNYNINHIVIRQDGTFNIIYGEYEIMRILYPSF